MTNTNQPFPASELTKSKLSPKPHFFLDKVFSFLYSIFQIAQGLLFHPYQTMQSLIREKVFVWMSFLPLALYLVALVFWRFILRTILILFWPGIFEFGFLAGAFSFLAKWINLFCLLWQSMLIYLLFRFYKAWKK